MLFSHLEHSTQNCQFLFKVKNQDKEKYSGKRVENVSCSVGSCYIQNGDWLFSGLGGLGGGGVGAVVNGGVSGTWFLFDRGAFNHVGSSCH